MTFPQYIVLTVVNVIAPNPQRQGTAQIQVINPPLRKLFPLPFEGNAEQGATPDRARFELTAPPLTIRCAETFGDVVAAIEEAAQNGQAIARPFQRKAIETAAHIAVAETVMGKDGLEKQLQEAGMTRIGPGSSSTDRNAVRWDEVMPKELHEPKPGDLRITNVVPQDSGQVDWRVQICSGRHEAKREDGSAAAVAVWKWGEESDVPAEIRRRYSTRDEARLAVRTAGYGRRLIEG